MSKIFTAVSHPEGYQGLPWFEIRGDKIYTTVSLHRLKETRFKP